MASKDRSSSNSDPRRASDAEKTTPGKKSSITRVRTGCYTCRKRKKKCDEKRPVCANCQKTGVVCEGFPQQVHWETRAALRRAESDMSMSMSSGVQNQMIAPGQTPGFNMPFMQTPQAMSNPMPTTFPQQNYGYIFDPHPGNVDYIFDEVDTPMPSHDLGGFIVNDSRDMMLGRGGFARETNTYDGVLAIQQQRQTYIPKEIPFLISGVETDVHQRLFCHFTRNLSQVLTISIGDENPMNSVVIPLALRDRAIMDTILCLAGSHLLKFREGMTEGEVREIQSETSKLHEAANATQTYRLQTLTTLQDTQTDTKIMPSLMNPGREVIFATSILLCLYEIVEGTSDSGWRTHLSSARQVITKAVEAISPENKPQTPENIAETHHVTEIDPFLIEYFLYHDSLAAVTVPSLQLTKLRSVDLANHDPTMVGVQDGLSDFIARISTLWRQAASSPYEVDGNVVSKAVLIWEDLHNWQPNGLISEERKMIAEFYRWALFIWLFSIVYPDGKEDPKVQEAVQRIAGEMCNIKYGDSVMSCILFPLFVIGAAAIREEDRAIVTGQFERLMGWSRLGNVDLTYQAVKKIWVDHDNGVPRSWDWVKQLETHGRYLLVT